MHRIPSRPVNVCWRRWKSRPKLKLFSERELTSGWCHHLDTMSAVCHRANKKQIPKATRHFMLARLSIAPATRETSYLILARRCRVLPMEPYDHHTAARPERLA